MNNTKKWAIGGVLAAAFGVAAFAPIHSEAKGFLVGYRGESDKIVEVDMMQPDGNRVRLDVRGLNMSDELIKQKWADQNHAAEIKTNGAEIVWNKIANWPAGDYGLHTISLK